MRTLAALFIALLLAVACDTGKTNPPKDAEVLGDADAMADSMTDVDEPFLPDDLPVDDALPATDDILPSDEEPTDDAVTETDDELVVDSDGELPDVDTTPPVLQGCLTGEFTAYFGNFHAHTGNSDGEGDPDSALAYARDSGGLDIQAITDHLEQLYDYYLPIPSDEYPDCRDSAAAVSTATFLALCGYEYGSGFQVSIDTGLNISTGHSNVFFNDQLMPLVQTDFHDYYASIAALPGIITQYNHSGDESLDQTFKHFEFDQSIFFQMALFEFNGAGPTWDLFFEALAAGWWLSPMFNQDNHSANWGTANDQRSGVFLTALDMPSLYDAFAQRRTFAANDKNAVIRLMAEDDCWMGSRLSGLSQYSLAVSVSDPDAGDTFTTIELYDPLKNVIATQDCAAAQECSLSFELSVTMPTYVVARAVQTDGNILVSAPIWMMP